VTARDGGDNSVRGKRRLDAIGASTRDTTMPRYYFHLTDGKTVLNNHQGMDLPGNAAAREDAVDLARDLKHGKKMPGWKWDGWFVAVIDDKGHKIDEVPIGDV
jgi:hypothetical protein